MLLMRRAEKSFSTRQPTAALFVLRKAWPVARWSSLTVALFHLRAVDYIS
jgi:hypothetical protein